jgi:hypothetical protein
MGAERLGMGSCTPYKFTFGTPFASKLPTLSYIFRPDLLKTGPNGEKTVAAVPNFFVCNSAQIADTTNQKEQIRQ